MHPRLRVRTMVPMELRRRLRRQNLLQSPAAAAVAYPTPRQGQGQGLPSGSVAKRSVTAIALTGHRRTRHHQVQRRYAPRRDIPQLKLVAAAVESLCGPTRRSNVRSLLSLMLWLLRLRQYLGTCCCCYYCHRDWF
jgi:hypothetical protein